MASKKRLHRTRSGLLLALLPGLLGIALVHWAPGANLEKGPGLDNLFRLRGKRTPPADVCVVAIDDDSYGVIGLKNTFPWPRGLHAQLIQTLAAEGARAVAFDVTFEEAGSDPQQDRDFAEALAEARNVILGASLVVTKDPKFTEARLVEPYEPFAKAAAAVAFVNLPTPPIRFAWPERQGKPGLALAAYELATGDASQRSERPRLIDYYGPARTINTVSIYQALDPKQYLPPGFFKGKLVFVGASEESSPGLIGKDSFATPFTGERGATTYGVEIHATLAADFLEHRQIRLLNPWLEALLLLLLPLTATMVFVYLKPVAGGAAFVLLLAAPWALAYLAFAQAEIWIPVVIPSAIQLPVAYGSSLVWYYLTTVREREKIKRAFGFYLSPEMIRVIAQDPDALNLGGEEIVGTAVFTDIKGFTPIAEGMSAPETAAMLNAYFSHTTQHVFDAGGTLIKYIGDAVFAIWGAPIHRPDHATQACSAALALARAQKSEIPNGQAARLVTRIGVHTGAMLVGNLGSAQRFDYTAIGDAVNLASRIEGVNKQFGTLALASDETIRATDGRFLTRSLGPVRVVGRNEPVILHELVATRDETGRTDAPLLETFAAALAHFTAGRFADAALGFRAALELTGGDDGPSAFFLKTAERLVSAPPERWDGVVVLESK